MKRPLPIYISYNQMILGTVPEGLIDRVLVDACNPHTSGYAVLCLICLNGPEHELTDHDQLTTWATTHRCDPAGRAAGYRLVSGMTRCLYCGSTDFHETPITVDDRTTEYALECDHCHGVWAP